ncbi:hypothetical protein ACIFOE_04720 [Paenibacillus sp. NRS-1783]|uniref:hypothetical protein n=1 Tax=Paenibacillus sp. NRS-1783 TaxID=3233907 RepID=UPI003D2DC2F4
MKKWMIIALAENTLFAMKGQIPEDEYEVFRKDIAARTDKMKKSDLMNLFKPIHLRYHEVRCK